MKRDGETYLGDGCFASFDGFQFCLRAPREFGDHMVYLDPQALAKFEEYIRFTKKGVGNAEGS